MFYCDACGEERGWPTKVMLKSVGPCELCKKTKECNDVPSSFLPESTDKQERS